MDKIIVAPKNLAIIEEVGAQSTPRLTLSDELDTAVVHLEVLRVVSLVAVPDLEWGAVTRRCALAVLGIHGASWARGEGKGGKARNESAHSTPRRDTCRPSSSSS